VKRRAFIAGLAGAAAWPVVARAQQTMPVVGFLHAGSLAGAADYVRSFLEGLAQIGYVEGRNIAIDYRWADGQSDRLSALADDLVRRRVAVIVASGSTRSARAAADATSTIPIVFHIADDPIEVGLAASLRRPGANRTGVTSFTSLLVPKRLELLHEALRVAQSDQCKDALG
jgi:putative ABC transport system substrate-binding protein